MFRYRHIQCDKMTDQEIASCATLFSEHYGYWSQDADEQRRGKRVRLSSEKIRKMFVNKPDRYVALVYDDDELIGQAFYLRRKLSESKRLKNKYVTFVLQLVVKTEKRGNKLGTKLLHSIWGLSNNYAWGLFTSNLHTIGALERATLRKIKLSRIRRDLDKIAPALKDVFEDTNWIKSFRCGCVDTQFPVDHTKMEAQIKKLYTDQNRKFPFAQLEPHQEWLAIIFGSQKVGPLTDEQLKILTETSDEVLRETYSRMDMAKHSWASHTKHEIDFLIHEGYIKAGDSILDIGCGTGRHVLELHQRGFNVHGIDFSSQMKVNKSGELASLFDEADILAYHPEQKYDVVLCLYDVIGSYSSNADNQKIVDQIAACLKPDGVAIVSVMNMHLTKKRCRKRCVDGIKEHIDMLMRLPASQTMQKTGDIFDGALLMIDSKSGVVYRKEQFFDENQLPAEFIIPDRRYTREELCRMFVKDFIVNPNEIRFVQAGHWDIALDMENKKAKEILLVAHRRKPTLLNKVQTMLKRL